MNRRICYGAIIATAAVFVLTYSTTAAPATTKVITVHVDDMHCANCSKKIARKLYAVPGVLKVKTNLKDHTALITPGQQRQPSPHAVWVAVEQAGFRPVLLEVGGRKFKKKPPR